MNPPLSTSGIPSSGTSVTASTQQITNASTASSIPLKTASLGHTSTATPQPPIKKVLVPSNIRGVPPPIPPNKPVVPPKRESSASRISLSNNTKDKESLHGTTQNVVSGVGNQSGVTGGGTTEVLEDELQDFQQVLCSMTNK